MTTLLHGYYPQRMQAKAMKGTGELFKGDLTSPCLISSAEITIELSLFTELQIPQ
jgi:hypothetical protein